PGMKAQRSWLCMLCLFSAAAVSAPANSRPAGADVQPNSPDAPSLVILGASYAKGWGTPPLPGFVRVTNRGVGGEETGGMLARFPGDVVAARPDAVLIWGHVNNITRAAPDKIEDAKKSARDHFAEMLRLARAAGIEPILATEIPWTEPGGIVNTLYGWYAAIMGKTSYATRVSAHVREVNEYLKSLCRRENCRVLDFEAVFADEDGTRKSEYAAEDGSHISQAGYDALTAYAARELRRAR
ncbi:MAG TPA: GDSL-type esterase/lipase family protein, partial [Steroidobacteraceae bacterium]|nr:GDSL-type esterase/lipase family protein [Steroidobacteraceae bacterium]